MRGADLGLGGGGGVVWKGHTVNKQGEKFGQGGVLVLSFIRSSLQITEFYCCCFLHGPVLHAKNYALSIFF